ncbi:MAG TPA: hypothetical protein IAB97_04405 [Candidatus Choladousia intestinipullorum]|nr:hypothetical protein [Candidatus Choladousia intestinipullorum]
MNFEELGRKMKKFSRDTVEEVQKMNEVRQLNGKINDAKKQITNLYTEIGKKLYEQYKESALTGFESEIQTINEKYFQIEELKDQIRGVKGVVLCPCCNMEVGAAERYCSNCGSKMPEVFEIVDGDEAADAVHVESEDVTEPAGGPEKSYETSPENSGADTETENICGGNTEEQAENRDAEAGETADGVKTGTPEA